MSILEDVLNGDMFITAVSFSEEGFQFDYMYRDQQSDNIMKGQTMVLFADTEERQMVFADIQESCRMLIRDADVELRENQ